MLSKHLFFSSLSLVYYCREEFVGIQNWLFVLSRLISGIRFITDAACCIRATRRSRSSEHHHFGVYDNFRYTLLNGEANGHNKPAADSRGTARTLRFA